MGRLNKDAPDYAEVRYKSAGQTNAKDLTPNLREDVVRGVKQDAERIDRGMNSEADREWNRKQQQNAAGRAITRMTSRAGLAGAALEGGYAAGRELDEKTGIGKKLVEKSGLGDLADKAVSRRDKVELSKSAKERVDEDNRFKEVERVLRETDEDIESSKYGKGDKYKRGGRVTVSKASRRADGIATKGKTRGRIL